MPIAVQIGNALYAIDTDHLNTPRRLTDSNGNPAWQWVTTGFGEIEPTTAATGFTRARVNTGTPIAGVQAVTFNLRYPGQQYDAETGLYYNHHRYYDPYLTVGYTQADPIGLAGGWNRYGYAGASALNWVDPEGLRFGTCPDDLSKPCFVFPGRPSPVVPPQPQDPTAGIERARQYLRDANGNSTAAWDRAAAERIARNWEALSCEGRVLRQAENYLMAYDFVYTRDGRWSAWWQMTAMTPMWQTFRIGQNMFGYEMDSPASLDAATAGYSGAWDALADNFNSPTRK